MTSTPPQEGDRTLAAVAYVLTWVTGLIIFFVAKKEDKYARWHAIQAIGFGVAATVVSIIASFLPVPFLSNIIWLLIVVGIIVLAIKAYQGEKIRLPIVAQMADKNA
jgi:uncharacterized membrane protein